MWQFKIRLLLISIVLCIYSILPHTLIAEQLQTIKIPSSLNPVGTGARAHGMGGAFITIADDATSASWNPGGLDQVKKSELSIVFACSGRSEHNTFDDYPDSSGKQSIFQDNLNFMSFTWPFSMKDRKMTLSLNIQHLYDFNREWDFPFLQHSSRFITKRDIHLSQKGRLSAFGLAYGIRINQTFSFGLTFNFWKNISGLNQWEQTIYENMTKTHLKTGKVTTNRIMSKNKYEFKGFNTNVGFIWRVNHALIMGAVVKTPFTADIIHESWFQSTQLQKFSEKETLKMPLSYGISLSYRASDALTVSADIYQTRWDKFMLTDSKNNQTNPISGLKTWESDIDKTTQIRLGMEYLSINKTYVIPLRLGLFYDPAPAEKSSDNYYGMSMGTGISMGGYVFDIAYQFRYGKNVGKSFLPQLGLSQNVQEHSLYVSFIYHIQ